MGSEMCIRDRIGPVPTSINELHEFCQRSKNADLVGMFVFDEDGKVLFNFGKYKGQVVKEILDKDPGYYGWMMNGDFPRYTKRVLRQTK